MTDLEQWEKDRKAFLIKIGQEAPEVVTPKPTKKEEE